MSGVGRTLPGIVIQFYGCAVRTMRLSAVEDLRAAVGEEESDTMRISSVLDR
jgi:hypothetical protein